MVSVEKISVGISNKLGDRLSKSKEEIQVINYGLFIMLHTSIGLIVTLLIGIFTNTTVEIMTISLSAAMLKRYSGGVHSSTPERCLITGFIFSLSGAIACVNLGQVLNEIGLLILIVIVLPYSYYEIYKKCPVPSKNKPLKNKKIRMKMRRKSFQLMCLYSLIIILFYSFYFKTGIGLLKTIILCILMGIIIQVYALNRVGYKVIEMLEKVFNFIHIN